jgi:hemolysin III
MYTPREEKWNIATHLIALILSMVGIVFLFKSLENSGLSYFPYMVYSIGLVIVFSMSSLYHYATDEVWKSRFKLFDHICIFILIGGTYLPIMMKYLDMPYCVYVSILIWILIGAGILSKLFYTNRYNKYFSATIYPMISMISLVIIPYMRDIPSFIVHYILYGGVFFGLGILFYIQKQREFAHAVWHCFVAVGCGMHYMAVYESIQF